MEIQVYRTVGGNLRIFEIYGLSEEAYKRFKKVGLPVYQSLSGQYNFRDDRAYTKEQILKIKKLASKIGGEKAK